MKLTFLLFLLCISGVWANKANSQTTKVSIQAENMHMKDILSQIESQTDFLFVYNYENVDLSQKVSLNASNISVAEVLKIIFRNSDVVYAMEGNNILLMKNTAEGQQQNSKNSCAGYSYNRYIRPVRFRANTAVPDLQRQVPANFVGYKIPLYCPDCTFATAFDTAYPRNVFKARQYGYGNAQILRHRF